jgi:hypothetical protein
LPDARQRFSRNLGIEEEQGQIFRDQGGFAGAGSAGDQAQTLPKNPGAGPALLGILFRAGEKLGEAGF